ncbi:hypothetical protein N2F28_10355, partial [Leuconostoc falkenbergense]
MSIRYSQDFKDSLIKLHQEGRSLKSLAEEFGPSKDSIAIWVKQAAPVMIQGRSKTLKDVKQSIPVSIDCTSHFRCVQVYSLVQQRKNQSCQS